MKGEQRGGLKLGQIKVTDKGCIALITFDCLCFKRTLRSKLAQKGDILDISIDYVDR